MDKIEVTQRARDFTGEYLFGLGNITLQSVDHIKSGDWDDTYHVKEIARFEREILSHTPQSVEPVALAHISLEDDGPYIDLQVLNGETLQPSTKPIPLYTHPPATDVAALVEAAKALFEMPGDIDIENNPPEMQREVLDARRQAWNTLRAALAPFTKGQDDG